MSQFLYNINVKESKLRYFIMTVDVDGWSSLLNFYSVPHDQSMADTAVNIEEGINKLKQLFDKHAVKATFFVTAEMAQKHSEAIKEVYSEGHEVACHGLSHKKDEFLGTKQEQERNLKKATKIIQKNIGCDPKGFRAPCLRANEITFKVLSEHGYLYDSSMVPTLVPGYYGNLFAPRKPYHPLSDFPGKGSRRLIELPVSVNPVIPLPFSAAWMRNLGLSWVKFSVKMNFILGNPVVFYVHPRDVLHLPRVKGVPWHVYHNVGHPVLRMLDELIHYSKLLKVKFMRALDFVEYLQSL